jgi:hypothetical protein
VGEKSEMNLYIALAGVARLESLKPSFDGELLDEEFLRQSPQNRSIQKATEVSACDINYGGLDWVVDFNWTLL